MPFVRDGEGNYIEEDVSEIQRNLYPLGCDDDDDASATPKKKKKKWEKQRKREGRERENDVQPRPPKRKAASVALTKISKLPICGNVCLCCDKMKEKRSAKCKSCAHKITSKSSTSNAHNEESIQASSTASDKLSAKEQQQTLNCQLPKNAEASAKTLNKATPSRSPYSKDDDSAASYSPSSLSDNEREILEEEDIEFDEATENGIREAPVQQEENFTILQFAIHDKGTLGIGITHKRKTDKVVIHTVINSIGERHGVKTDDEVTVVRDSHGNAITTQGGENLYNEFKAAAGRLRPLRFDVKRHSRSTRQSASAASGGGSGGGGGGAAYFGKCGTINPSDFHTNTKIKASFEKWFARQGKASCNASKQELMDYFLKNVVIAGSTHLSEGGATMNDSVLQQDSASAKSTVTTKVDKNDAQPRREGTRRKAADVANGKISKLPGGGHVLCACGQMKKRSGNKCNSCAQAQEAKSKKITSKSSTNNAHNEESIQASSTASSANSFDCDDESPVKAKSTSSKTNSKIEGVQIDLLDSDDASESPVKAKSTSAKTNSPIDGVIDLLDSDDASESPVKAKPAFAKIDSKPEGVIDLFDSDDASDDEEPQQESNYPFATFDPDVDSGDSGDSGGLLNPCEENDGNQHSGGQAADDSLDTTTISAAHNEKGNADRRPGPDGANLFVFHIPNGMTNAHLLKLFSPFGNVLSERIDTVWGKEFGFVSFDRRGSAAEAITALHGFQVQGKRLKVQHKQSTRSASPAGSIPAGQAVESHQHAGSIKGAYCSLGSIYPQLYPTTSHSYDAQGDYSDEELLSFFNQNKYSYDGLGLIDRLLASRTREDGREAVTMENSNAEGPQQDSNDPFASLDPEDDSGECVSYDDWGGSYIGLKKDIISEV